MTPFKTARAFLPFVIVLACAACMTVPAFAQGSTESQDVHARNDCRLAAQTLQKGHPAPKTDWALSIINMCDASGPAALQALWVTPTTDPVALEQLVQASARLLDQRVYLGVVAVAQNTGAARAVRAGALRVLAAFLDNHTQIDQRDLLASPKTDSTSLSRFSTISGGMGQTVGTQPLAASVPSDVRALFASLALSDPDPVLRHAGRNLKDWFSRKPL